MTVDRLVDDVSVLADNHHMKVLIEDSGKGAVICGASVFIGIQSFNLLFVWMKRMMFLMIILHDFALVYHL